MKFTNVTKIIGISVIAVMITGCSGSKSITLVSDKQNTIRGKRITVVEKDSLIKPGKMAHVGPYVDINLIAAILQDIENKKTTGTVFARPTHEIARRTMALLNKKYKMVEVKNRAGKNFKSDYILEVETAWTSSWSIGTTLSNRIRLINLKNKKVAAQSICMYKFEKNQTGNAKNNKKFIRREARKAIESCMKKIKTQILVKPGKAKLIKDPDFMNIPIKWL